MEMNRTETTGRTLQDLGTAVREGEEMLKSGAVAGSDRTHALMARLESAIERAKVACQRLEAKTIAGAKATDKAIHEHPYPALGLAFGVGLLVGVLVMRRRND
jgi:ElaB/YqjD/DUF883 family membrane-anchored ribosome-binding protein